MSLRPSPASTVPEETAKVARAAFRRGCLLMDVRDGLGPVFDDARFARLFAAVRVNANETAGFGVQAL